MQCLECKRKYAAKWRKRSPKKRLLHSAKHRAKRDGMEFSITMDDIDMPQTCPVLGIPIDLEGNKRTRYDRSPSIDRRDTSRGYVPGNVFVISNRANRLKSDATIQEVEAILAYMKGD